MFANLLNVVIGIALVYAAVLQPALVDRRPALLFAAAGVIGVAAWLARRSDYHPWQNNVNMMLALMLACVAALPLEHFPLATFWTQFSVGTMVAVLALWATLYRPSASPT